VEEASVVAAKIISILGFLVFWVLAPCSVVF